MLIACAAIVSGCYTVGNGPKDSKTTFAKDALAPYVENGQLPGAVHHHMAVLAPVVNMLLDDVGKLQCIAAAGNVCSVALVGEKFIETRLVVA